MGELAEGAGERVVGLVVCVVLEVVALPDLVFAVAAVGFVVDEVDLSEEFFLVLLSLFVTLGLSDIILPQPVSLLETTL